MSSVQSLVLVPPLREEPLQVFPWAGGKERIAGPIAARILEALLQNPDGAYFEPFMGSAAIYLRLRAHGWEGRAVLSDAAPHLLSLCRAIAKGEPWVSYIANDLRILDSTSEAERLAWRKEHPGREPSPASPESRTGVLFPAEGKPAPTQEPAAEGKPKKKQAKAAAEAPKKRREKATQGGEDFYRKIRACFNEAAGVAGPGSATPEAQAARFLFLVHRSFNGLWRQNKKGEMNTPYGGDERKTPMPTHRELAALCRHLQRATLELGDFEPRIDRAAPGDVVYADSPYIGSYDGYNGGFTEADHLRLRDALFRAWRRGVYVFASNLDSPKVRELYAGMRFTPVTLIHSVGGTKARIRKRQELLIEARP